MSARLGVLLAGALLAGLAGSALAAPPSAEVDRRINPFPVTHRCNREPAAPACPVLRGIMLPDWTKPEDVVILPHRGYWGFGDVADVPENSATGYRGVVGHRYAMSEVDFMPSADGVVMSHDYVLTRLTQVPPLDPRLVFNLPSATLEALHLRDRFGVVRNDQFLTAQDTFRIFASTYAPGGQMPVIFADIKQKPVSGNPYQYAVNWVDTLSALLAATPPDQLYQLVIKTPYKPRFIIQHLKPEVRNLFLEVMWMPQVGEQAEMEQAALEMGEPMPEKYPNSAITFIRVWDETTGVAAYETNYKGPDDNRLQPFAFGRRTYANILDYIQQNTGRRGGVFAEEPVGPRGVVNRMGVWAYKDAAEDMRGDFIFEAVAPKWGNFIVVTTDRPDVWEQVKHVAWSKTAIPPETGTKP